tara:strand:+ start:434 stop:1339 length:906 start_codon:yes stop_codon:yes gene_type:complete
MANTTATGLTLSGADDLTYGQKIAIESAMVAFEPAAPNPDLIWSQRIPEGHKQWDVSTYARLATASALTEGVDLAQTQKLYTNILSITPSEHGIISTVSKRLIRRQGDSNVVSTTGALIGGSLRRRMDLDVIAMYNNLSKAIVGSGSPLDITYFRGAVAYLMTDNDTEFGPAPMPLRASLHIEQISDIILDITDPGTTAVVSRPAGFGDEMLQRWWRGNDRLYGIAVWHAGNMPRDGSEDAKGGIFASECMAIVVADNAEVTEESDNSLRAVEYGVFQEWSEGERADPWGVEVYSNAATTV